MGGKDEAQYDTDALRHFADDLQVYGENIEVGKEMVGAGKVTNAAWGIPGFQPFIKDPAGGEWDPPNFQAIPELKAFRAAYEAAHESTVGRLRELSRAYLSAAVALRNVADHYDGVERDFGDRFYTGTEYYVDPGTS